jgi:transcriptional regulator with XRE-family HTH domain
MKPEHIKLFRERNNYTQERLAKILGYASPTAIQNVIKQENGRGGIPGPVARIIEAMERDPRVRIVFEALAT